MASDTTTASNHLLYTGLAISLVNFVQAQGIYLFNADGRQILDSTLSQRMLR